MGIGTKFIHSHCYHFSQCIEDIIYAAAAAAATDVWEFQSRVLPHTSSCNLVEHVGNQQEKRYLGRDACTSASTKHHHVTRFTILIECLDFCVICTLLDQADATWLCRHGRGKPPYRGPGEGIRLMHEALLNFGCTTADEPLIWNKCYDSMWPIMG